MGINMSGWDALFASSLLGAPSSIPSICFVLWRQLSPDTNIRITPTFCTPRDSSRLTDSSMLPASAIPKAISTGYLSLISYVAASTAIFHSVAPPWAINSRPNWESSVAARDKSGVTFCVVEHASRKIRQNITRQTRSLIRVWNMLEPGLEVIFT